ncbi:hypothetical protein APHAL10511_001804 [Amanita phalloides]|nr:hypothetical protein APHAL10511_001804 [Amanita phalloides]
MAISTLYVAAATNRFSQTADVSSASLVAFGSSRLIALWHIKKGLDTNIQETLSGHEGLVTCVRFASEQLLISADNKGAVILWRNADGKWEIASKAAAHTQSISSLCIYGDCLVTGSSDATVKIWKIDRSSIVQIQALPQGKRYPLALAMTSLPNSKAMVLAVSGTDKNVNLWLRSSSDSFVHSASLVGHEDWVRSLAFRTPFAKGEPLVLASASQDATIRLWKIESIISERSSHAVESSDELLDNFEASLADMGDAEEGGRQISLKRHVLTVKSDLISSQRFSVTFDALLIGHEAGVTCLSWRPIQGQESAPTLLSASTDSSVIMWSPSTVLTRADSGNNAIWINRQRFGDVGGQRLGGFVGAIWAQDGQEALAWGWTGGWRRWRCNDLVNHESEEIWDEVGAVSGHNAPVRGLSWSPSGEFLISAGLDQTSRIHAPVRDVDDHTFWHEVARPQVHGYDLLDAVFVNPLGFASIADEKVMRVFEAPRSFVDFIQTSGIVKFSEEEHKRPITANVPPLGLSNKAVVDSVSDGNVMNSSRRPLEGELAAITLWPEVDKVFGHGYESITLGVSHSRHLIATACKAASPEHALVRLYNAQSFRPVGQPLPGHSLTVTRVAFSPDDRYLLTVSRDRSWKLFELQQDGGYALVAAADKSHGRIVWDCAWSQEGDCFATASRDRTVKIWQCTQGGSWISIAIIKTESGATAVDFAARDALGRHALL